MIGQNHSFINSVTKVQPGKGAYPVIFKKQID